VNEADKLDLIDPDQLRKTADRCSGRPGVRALRSLLDRDTFRLSDSELEVMFRPIAAAAGLSPPRAKAIVNGFEVDFHWPDLRLVIETDGLRYHRTPSAQARDQVRDQTHTAHGLTVLRFTHYQVQHEPRYVRHILEATVRAIQSRSCDWSG
jgi:very-short-patch-repair endonuclease